MTAFHFLLFACYEVIISAGSEVILQIYYHEQKKFLKENIIFSVDKIFFIDIILPAHHRP